MTGTPGLKLQPRLFMLAHSGRHLILQLQAARQLQRTFAEFLAPRPVAWELLQRTAAPLRQTQVESLQALSLPPQAGIAACLIAGAPEQVRPETAYRLPELVLELLDPQEQVIQTKTVVCGSFRTFNAGTPVRQLLEYLATTLDFELNPWGWSCRRQGEQLRFDAHPLLAGWNLRLRELSFAPGSTERTAERFSGGLKAGISSLDPGQVRGRQALVHWGPWLINETSCELRLPFSDAESFAEAFVAGLNQQLAAGNQAAAVWGSAGQLLLLSRRPGGALRIVAGPMPEPAAPDFRLGLALPEGSFGSAAQAQELGGFELNGNAIELTPPELEPDGEWLCACINRHSPITGVHAELSPAGHLHLLALQPQRPLILAAVPDLLQRALGLSNMRLGESDEAGLQAALARWTLLLNQVLADLPPGLSELLENAAAAVPPLAGDFGAGRLSWQSEALNHSLELMLVYLEEVMAAVDACLQAPETQPAKNLRPLQFELQQTELSPHLNEPAPKKEPPPSSTFDHKI